MSREITSSEGLFRPLGLGMPFRCRSCQKVAYPSQREDRASRALRRARGLRYRLGGSGNNLVRQYEIWKAIEDQASLAADEARLRRDVETQERAETADSQAARKVNEILRRAQGIHATSPRALGLRACLIADHMSDWWDHDELDFGEIMCRALLDELMSAGGVAPLRRNDVTPEEMLELLKPVRPAGGEA